MMGTKINRYKIVFITPALYSAGGVERVVSVKANYFADILGYDVGVVVTEGKGRDTFFPLSERVKVINLELDFEELWRLSFWRKIIVYIQKQRQYKRRLTAELMRIHPTFVISTLRREINFLTDINDGSIKIGELHVNRANYRSLGERNSNVVKRVFACFWSRSLVRHLKQLDMMVVLTDSAFNDWPELNHIMKIPDPLPFKIDAKSLLSPKRVISIGRYAYDKGNDMLLQIWADVEKKMPDWRLDIYGNGNREPYYNMMQQLDIDTARCQLYGPTSDVKSEYLSSSIFVLPSRFEGFGLVIIESMACGLPVISFDCENGPSSIITDSEEGFLIPTFDVKMFADRLVTLMKDEDLRRKMGVKGYRKSQQYDIDVIGKQWQQLFDELMQKDGI